MPAAGRARPLHPMPRTLLLFDLDGTLLLTGGAGSRSFERAYHTHFGVTLRSERLKMDGMTDPAIARHFLRLYGLPPDDRSVDLILSGYLAGLADEVAASTRYRVLPDVMESLEELAARGDVLLGLATGNIEKGARIKLERAGLNRFFPFGGFGSDAEDRVEVVKTAIARGRAHAGEEIPPSGIVVIGDTPKAVAAGKAAGVKTLAVATGSYGLEALTECSPDLVLPTLARPSRWLRTLMGRA